MTSQAPRPRTAIPATRGATLPPFAVRGVIEGFYGNPWTHDERLRFVDFLADHAMTTFVYGPKDDPLVRRDWRLPYGGDELARFGEILARCRARGIELLWCISPGRSIAYSSEADVNALAAKIASVRALGVRSFGLLLDDIPMELQHPEDRAVHGELALAHVALVARLLARMEPSDSLVVCPTVYWGEGDEPYLARLGSGLDPRVSLFWTGRAICAPRIDLREAERFAATAGRPPLYWDNYPVNDVAMTFELHVGPYLGRDPRLATASRGIVANPMELFEASRIPLATIADFLRDPGRYDPEASWLAAIREVAGADDAEDFATFAENVRSSCLSQADAPTVSAALEAFAFRADLGEPAAAGDALLPVARRLRAAAERLLDGRRANPALIDECRPWLRSFRLGAEAMERLATLAVEGRLARDARDELLPYLAALREARVRVFGDALDMSLAEIIGIHVRPGELTRAGGGPG